MSTGVQGTSLIRNHRPPGTLPWAYAEGPGGGRFLMIEVPTQFIESTVTQTSPPRYSEGKQRADAFGAETSFEGAGSAV